MDAKTDVEAPGVDGGCVCHPEHRLEAYALLPCGGGDGVLLVVVMVWWNRG